MKRAGAITSIRGLALAVSSLGLASAVAGAARVPEALPAAPPLPAAVRAQLETALADRGSGYQPRTRHLRADGSPLFSNRLLLESSPYLQQHAHNPVNWYPWGDAAFAAARRLGRPVLVSIGYSTCHWCHVMEEESFDDIETAELLNSHFIAIKVDRESRPDVDAVYMSAAYAIAGQGGWPLNVWLTPERKPFYAGTYFPKTDRGQRPGFKKLLTLLQAHYRDNPQEIEKAVASIEQVVRSNLEGARATASWNPSAAPLDAALRAYRSRFDPEWGGIGRGQKFPSSLHVRFLLRQHRRSGDPLPLSMATKTLEKMAAGGIRDHLGGGFHRYATERRWLVPHFEKMLYDNALLSLAYTEAWQLTGRSDFRAVARETLDYVAREMTNEEGAFHSATDADSRAPGGEMEEGWFFTWTPGEIDALLSAEDAAVFKAYYGVTPAGNFEGRNILHTWKSRESVAAELAISSDELRRRIERARPVLYAARAERPPPLRDDKVLVAWNGLMISAFARAGFAFDSAQYLERAERAAQSVIGRARNPGGRLERVATGGDRSGPAFLEDYAFLIAGLLDLYEAGGDPRWLRTAIELQAVLDHHYADEAGGGYFRSAADGEQLIVREKPDSDGAVPSGNSVAALNLLRLYAFTTDADYLARADLIFAAFEPTLGRSPTSVAELLMALDFQLEATREIAVLRPAAAAGALDPLLAALRDRFLPNRVLSLAEPGRRQATAAGLVPWVNGKVLRGGRPTAFVCVDQVCNLPTSEPAELVRQVTPALYESGPEADRSGRGSGR